MGYIEENLNPGERILHTTRLHWIVLLQPILLDAVLSIIGLYLLVATFSGDFVAQGNSRLFGMSGLGLIILGNLLLGAAVLQRNAVEMAVTNKRVIIKVGLLTSRTVELFLPKVESVGVEQTVAGRMFGFGSITVRGTGGTHEPFAHVDHPMEFRRQVQHQTELYLAANPHA